MDGLGGPEVQGMVERLKALWTRPAETWPAIAAEQTTPGDLITRWAIPLAAIRPVCEFLHGQLFGYGGFGISYTPGFMFGLSQMVVSYVLGLVGVIVLALIADWLAPKFGGKADRTAAFKLVVFGSTAAWVAGIFQLIPWFGILGIVGLYSLYLYYSGAAPLMKVPQEQSLAYTAVTIVCAILLYLAATVFTGGILGLFGMSAMSAMGAADSGKVEIDLPGGGKLDTSKVEDAAKQLEGLANGETPKPIDIAQLQALLPGSIGAYQRTAVEANGVGGIGSTAEATYKNGDKQIRVRIVDMAAMGAVAGIVGGLGVEQNREDENGYERTRTVDGKIQTEKWETKESRGSFGTMVGTRFMVEAEGEAGSIDELKAIVAGIDAGKLEALAK